MSQSVLVVGEVSSDFVFNTIESSDSLKWTSPPEFTFHHYGGMGANVAVTYSALGASVSLATFVDTAHIAAFNILNDFGIRIIELGSGKMSTICNISFPDRKRRSVLISPGKALTSPHHCHLPNLEFDIVHITPMQIDTVTDILAQIGCKTSIISPALEYSSLQINLAQKFFNNFNIVVTDLHEAFLYYKACEESELYERLGNCNFDFVAVVTMAEKGSFAVRNGDFHRVPSEELEKIFNPFGCGDAFSAGFCYCYHLFLGDIKKALRVATKCANNFGKIDGGWEVLIKSARKSSICRDFMNCFQ